MTTGFPLHLLNATAKSNSKPFSILGFNTFGFSNNTYYYMPVPNEAFWTWVSTGSTKIFMLLFHKRGFYKYPFNICYLPHIILHYTSSYKPDHCFCSYFTYRSHCLVLINLAAHRNEKTSLVCNLPGIRAIRNTIVTMKLFRNFNDTQSLHQESSINL